MQITDEDLKMFKSRSRTELESRGDMSRMAWDVVVPALCDEVAELRRKLEAATDDSGFNAAKLREAVSDACYAMFDFLKAQSGGYEKMADALDKAKAALAAPPRNCDRFGGDIDKLREACARERGLNPEEDFPDVFPDWLLAPATEKEGGVE